MTTNRSLPKGSDKDNQETTMNDIAKQTKRMNRILDDAHEMAQKRYDEPAERMMFELVHAAIAIAGDHGRERSAVARSIGLTRDTLNERLRARPDRSFRIEELARMIFDPRVLGDDAHAWLLEQLAVRAGRRFLMPMSDEPVETPEREALEVVDATGMLSMMILQVSSPDSDGGRFITDAETRKIAASAGAVIDEAGDLVRPMGMPEGVMA